MIFAEVWNNIFTMRILIVSQYFWPENFKINEAAIYLREMGHEVTVLTGMPNYPEGKFYSGYSFMSPASELHEGIEVYRLPTIPRGKRNAVKLILNYIFFPLTGKFFWRKLLRNKTFDVVFVCQLSPVFVGLLGARIKKTLEIPMAMWVLDLWPESVFAASSLKPFLIEKVLKSIVHRIYKSCDKILVSSRSFTDSIKQYGYSIDNISYLPNWADDVQNTVSEEKLRELPGLPEGFVILFAGNIGDAQDIETLMKGIELVKHIKDLKLVFLGDGRKRIWLESEIINRNLSDKVFWLGQFPPDTMPYFFEKASVLLVSLKSDPAFALTVPAKLQTYMANRKTVISMLSGAGNEIVSEANCGICISSGDEIGLANAIEGLSKTSSEDLRKMGINGYNYYIENFKKDKVLKTLDSFLQRMNC